MYDPRYRPYDSTAASYAEGYRYPEPERPSSRASHSSDRPPARWAQYGQGVPCKAPSHDHARPQAWLVSSFTCFCHLGPCAETLVPGAHTPSLFSRYLTFSLVRTKAG